MIDMQTSQGDSRRDDPDTDWVLENRSHTYLPGHAEISGADPTTGAYRYYYTDHLGSVRQMRADDGADPDSLSDPVAAYEYDPYGGAYHLSGLALNRGYTGHKWDPATGMYFAPYRYYTPGNARWLTQDPLGLAMGPNLYTYVYGVPTALTDPSGAFVPFAWILLGALGGAVAGGIQQSDCGWSSIFTGALLGATTGSLAAAGALLGPWVGALAGGLTGAIDSHARGGSPLTGMFVGGLSGIVGGAIGARIMDPARAPAKATGVFLASWDLAAGADVASSLTDSLGGNRKKCL